MKRLVPLLCALALLAGCTGSRPEGERSPALRVLCTTYPVYLFTTAVTQGAADVEVDLLVDQNVSCLHDYTLTVNDMKAIEAAGVIVMNGAGLEDFMSDALARSDAAVLDCSAGLDLLPALEADHGHGDQNHGEDCDPHIWMDPHRAGQMVENIAAGLAALDPDRAAAYGENRDAALRALSAVDPVYRDVVFPPCELITFHDGFQYFAAAQGFDLLAAIEEEEGSTASAAELKELTALIRERDIPAIFTEKNGSGATARTLARETGCAVYELDMLMSGGGSGIQPYLDAMEANLTTILEALQ